MQKGDYCCLGAMICRGVCIMVITRHFFGWKFGKDLFLLMWKFSNVKRMA